MENKFSHLTPNERIARLEAELAAVQSDFSAVGSFGIMLLEQTLQQLVGERLLPAETEREIWRRIMAQLPMVRALNSKLEYGANHAIPTDAKWVRSLPRPRTHREKLRLRMRRDEADQ